MITRLFVGLFLLLTIPLTMLLSLFHPEGLRGYWDPRV